jgi:uncharacterized damage-inducible protein DinB
MSEPARIADQLRRAFYGEAWYGDALFEILDGVSAAQAAARPVKHAHSIWELVLHVAAWDGVARRRLAGETVELSDEQNFPPVQDTSEGAWRRALERVRQVHDDLIKDVVALPDSRLCENVPGTKYDIYRLLHGAVQHELYHAGQVAILKKI